MHKHSVKSYIVRNRKLGNFTRIEVITLLDNDATKANILNVIRRLSSKTTEDSFAAAGTAKLEQITPLEPEDAVFLYFSGHGTALRDRFYFIPYDMGYAGPRTSLDSASLATVLAHSVSDLELEAALESIDAGHILLILDTSNSGQALEVEERRLGPMNSKGLAQSAYEKGMYILTASQSYQAATETAKLREVEDQPLIVAKPQKCWDPKRSGRVDISLLWPDFIKSQPSL